MAFGRNVSWTTDTVGDVAATDVVRHPWPTHMSYNYGRYYRSLPPDKELIVLRNSRLYEDWVKVNQLLIGVSDGNTMNEIPTPPPFQENVRNVSSQYRTKDRWRPQSPMEQQWLCSLLYNEIRTYILILSRAINLNEDDLREALEDVNEMCNQRGENKNIVYA